MVEVFVKLVLLGVELVLFGRIEQVSSLLKVKFLRQVVCFVDEELARRRLELFQLVLVPVGLILVLLEPFEELLEQPGQLVLLEGLELAQQFLK